LSRAKIARSSSSLNDPETAAGYRRAAIWRLAPALGLACLACGVPGREALVGRYVAAATGEKWVLNDDGSCAIERAGTTVACEWEYRERMGETRLVVTITAVPGSASPGRRYVLTPSKWPGRPVTIPLSPSATLERQDGGDATR
jgi:hypothetical protein